MFNSFESLKCSLPASLLLNELWDKALKKKTRPFRNNILHLFGTHCLNPVLFVVGRAFKLL